MQQPIQDMLTANGVDVPATVARFGGNEALYLKYLCRFPQDSSFQSLESAMQGGLRENVQTACHTLKGVSGTLGLTPLYTAASDMMAALRQNDMPSATTLFEAVTRAYRQAIAMVQSIGV